MFVLPHSPGCGQEHTIAHLCKARALDPSDKTFDVLVVTAPALVPIWTYEFETHLPENRVAITTPTGLAKYPPNCTRILILDIGDYLASPATVLRGRQAAQNLDGWQEPEYAVLLRPGFGIPQSHQQVQQGFTITLASFREQVLTRGGSCALLPAKNDISSIKTLTEYLHG